MVHGNESQLPVGLTSRRHPRSVQWPDSGVRLGPWQGAFSARSVPCSFGLIGADVSPRGDIEQMVVAMGSWLS